MDNIENKTEQSKFPHTLVLLFVVLVVIGVLTWIIPAGEFDRVMRDGRTIVVPGSFQYVERSPQNPFDCLLAIPEAFKQVQDIVFFILVSGGAFALINETGTLIVSINKLTQMVKGKELLIIPLVIFVISLAGTTIGLNEETIVLLPLGIMMARMLGFDAIVGMAIIQLGAAVGFNAGIMNPFTVGLSQQIAELPLFSGLWLRVIIFIVFWAVTSLMVISYAKKVRADKKNSIIYHLELEAEKNNTDEFEDSEFTRAHLLILAVFILGFALIGYGVFNLGWFIQEIGAVFLAMGILSAIIGRIKPNKIGELYVEGSKEMIFACLVIVLARAVLVIMQQGLILDSIIHSITVAIGFLPKSLSVVGMYIAQIIINFLIPSGSGQAAATMPIMVPLADTIGITRQTSVLAYQFGAGLMDSILPTSGVLMAQLSISKISYNEWGKFMKPIMTAWILMGLAFLLLATFINYGPF